MNTNVAKKVDTLDTLLQKRKQIRTERAKLAVEIRMINKEIAKVERS